MQARTLYEAQEATFLGQARKSKKIEIIVNKVVCVNDHYTRAISLVIMTIVSPVILILP